MPSDFIILGNGVIIILHHLSVISIVPLQEQVTKQVQTKLNYLWTLLNISVQQMWQCTIMQTFTGIEMHSKTDAIRPDTYLS